MNHTIVFFQATQASLDADEAVDMLQGPKRLAEAGVVREISKEGAVRFFFPTSAHVWSARASCHEMNGIFARPDASSTVNVWA